MWQKYFEVVCENINDWLSCLDRGNFNTESMDQTNKNNAWFPDVASIQEKLKQRNRRKKNWNRNWETENENNAWFPDVAQYEKAEGRINKNISKICFWSWQWQFWSKIRILKTVQFVGKTSQGTRYVTINVALGGNPIFELKVQRVN